MNCCDAQPVRVHPLAVSFPNLRPSAPSAAGIFTSAALKVGRKKVQKSQKLRQSATATHRLLSLRLMCLFAAAAKEINER